MNRSIEQTCEYNKVPFKIVLLGDGCIGKSTLFDKLNNINNDYTFNKKYKVTDNFDLTRLNIKTNNTISKNINKYLLLVLFTIMLFNFYILTSVNIYQFSCSYK